eukprot:GHVT01075109.1.p1 GENE.GHVT01075109.1~~GHVT01075109.1.p1  ORF type:complete len:130 (+),score=16.58 GHVT01075109.1:245-634(+)
MSTSMSSDSETAELFNLFDGLTRSAIPRGSKSRPAAPRKKTHKSSSSSPLEGNEKPVANSEATHTRKLSARSSPDTPSESPTGIAVDGDAPRLFKKPRIDAYRGEPPSESEDLQTLQDITEVIQYGQFM